MSNNNYKFTNLTHEQILDIIEQYRVKNNLSKSELARRAGYTKTLYSNMQRNNSPSRFSRKSFNAFMNLCNAETERTLFNAINKRIEENPNANHIEAAIQLLKSTGKYKILELQQTWNEL
jgi:transcriptional regulator with XRE-family HTH domain